MKSGSKSFRYLAWITALGLAAWVFSRLPQGVLLQAVKGLGLPQWLIWISLNLAVIAVFTGRWLVLTRAIALPVGFFQLLRVRQAGQVISFVTPGPQFGGEALQVYWLWKHYALPGHAALLAVGLDRFYELWINLLVLLLGVLALLGTATVDFVNWEAIAIILLGVVLIMGMSARFLLRQPDLVGAWIRRLTTPWRDHAGANARCHHSAGRRGGVAGYSFRDSRRRE